MRVVKNLMIILNELFDRKDRGFFHRWQQETSETRTR